jgi:hypothetical protein
MANEADEAVMAAKFSHGVRGRRDNTIFEV